ncbi:MAG: enolase C-terminal domain-like protein [Deltaproteobacteria bacterium]
MAELPLLCCQRQQWELEPPLHNARGQWRTRNALNVLVRDRAGGIGQGEAAPLPDYSFDTLEATERALRAIPAVELERLLQLEGPAAVVQATSAVLPAELPAARFALETALLDRLGQRQRRPLWSLLRELLAVATEPASAVPLCVLLPSVDPAAALRAAVHHFTLGVRCFKLKIGPDRLQPAQAALLAALRGELGDAISLRLDANQSLQRAELAETFQALARYRPEFVEEPVSAPEPGELAQLPCGWALDESLQRIGAEQLLALSSSPGCRALVLKPTALGGFGRCAELAERARARGQAAVVSHVFEGERAWLACAHLAVALGPGAAAGLWPMALPGRGSELVHSGMLQPPSDPGLGVTP